MADAEQDIPAGSSLTLDVQTFASAWPPGDYRLTVRLLDESSLPLDVMREFTVDAWSGEIVRRGLDMLQAKPECDDWDHAWSMLFDRADSGFLNDWLEVEELRAKAARHAVSRGGHDAVLTEQIDRHPEILPDVVWSIPRGDLPVRPLVSAIATRLLEQLLTPDTPSLVDNYHELGRLADAWPAGTRERLIDRLASGRDPAELEAMLRGVFFYAGLFVGYEDQIRPALAARCLGSGGDLRTLCDELLGIYSKDLSNGRRRPFMCGTHGHSQCGASPEWGELVARAGETSIAWGENRVTRPASY